MKRKDFRKNVAMALLSVINIHRVKIGNNLYSI